MIKFAGNPSALLKKYIKKKEYISTVIIAMVLFILFSSIVITVSLLTDLIGLLCLIFTTVFSMLLLLPQKDIEKRLPQEIIIDGEEIIFKSERNLIRREFCHIKRIVDNENWFAFVFNFPYKNIYFVCQKDLLVEGTLEEFEVIFAEKITKKFRKE